MREYDLVILGGALEGRQAAQTSLAYGARVALVEPPGLFARRQQVRYLLQGLGQLGDGLSRQAVTQWFCTHVDRSIERSPEPELDWSALVHWSAIAAKTQQPELSLSALSASGADVIMAMPERISRKQVVTAGGRRLSTRAVLAAFGSVPCAVFESSYFPTPVPTGLENLLDAEVLPSQVFIWGGSFEAVAWAEALCLVGVKVTLVADPFLPGEDFELKGRLRSQLRSMGMTITSPSDVLNPSKSSFNSSSFDNYLNEIANCSVLLGRQKPALVLPDFVYYPSSQYPEAEEQAFGQTNESQQTNPSERTYLLTNQKLQTAHPRIFACGSLIHRNATSTGAAGVEMQVAVRNALFLPSRQVDYRSISNGYARYARIGSSPNFALAGRSPARQDGDYQVFSASSPNSTDLRRVNPFTSYCKIICKFNRVQSVHLLGDGADGLSKLLANAIGKPLDYLSNLTGPSSSDTGTDSLTTLVQAAASQPQQTHWHTGKWRKDWAENWFNWRRSR
ncbi:MAG: hypothetical protein AAFY72_02140 [Cyanobacteria bacterium J06649_4]